MLQSEQTGMLAEALAKAQAKIKNPKQNADVRYGQTAFKYADLSACLEAVLPHLSANGIALTQYFEHRDEGALLMIITRLTHASGQWMACEYPCVIQGKHQDIGAAITYGRRYGLAAMCGIFADPDNDAQTATDLGPSAVKVDAKRLTAAQVKKPGGPWDEFEERLSRFKTMEDHNAFLEYKRDIWETAQSWPRSIRDEMRPLFDAQYSIMSASDQLDDEIPDFPGDE